MVVVSAETNKVGYTVIVVLLRFEGDRDVGSWGCQVLTAAISSTSTSFFSLTPFQWPPHRLLHHQLRQSSTIHSRSPVHPVR